jgi:hypothetical protein
MPNNCQHPQATAAQGQEIMAIVLEAQHGMYAAEVADFFAGLLTNLGDESRSRAWAGVAEHIRLRECERFEQG